MYDTLFNTTILSQIEFSFWEYTPGLILFTLASLLAFYHLKTEQRKDKREIKVFPIKIKTPVTETLTAKTVNISSGGAFLDYEDLKKNKTFIDLLDESTGTMKVGDLIDIEIPLEKFKKINCQASIVRKNFSNHDIPPKGLAIKFVHLSEKQEQELNSLIYKQKAS